MATTPALPATGAIVPVHDAFIARPDGSAATGALAHIQTQKAMVISHLERRDTASLRLVSIPASINFDTRHDWGGRLQWFPDINRKMFNGAKWRLLYQIPLLLPFVVRCHGDFPRISRNIDSHNRLTALGLFETSPSEATRWRFRIQSAAEGLAAWLVNRAFSRGESDDLHKAAALERLLLHARAGALDRFDHIVRPSDIPPALARLLSRSSDLTSESIRRICLEVFRTGESTAEAAALFATWRDVEAERARSLKLVQSLNHDKGFGIPEKWLEPLTDYILCTVEGDAAASIQKILGQFKHYIRFNPLDGSNAPELFFGFKAVEAVYMRDTDRYQGREAAKLFGNKTDGTGGVIALGKGLVYAPASNEHATALAEINSIASGLAERRWGEPVASYNDTDHMRLAHELWMRLWVLKEANSAPQASEFEQWLVEEAQRIVAEDEGDAPAIALRLSGAVQARAALPLSDDADIKAKARWVAGLSLFEPSAEGFGAWRHSIQGGTEMLASILSRYAFETDGIKTETARKREIMSAARNAAIEARDHVIRPSHVKGALAMITGVSPTDTDWNELEDSGGLSIGVRSALDVWRKTEIAVAASPASKGEGLVTSRSEVERLFAATKDVRAFMEGMGEEGLASARLALSGSADSAISDADVTHLLWEVLKVSGVSADDAMIVDAERLPAAFANAREQSSEIFERYSGAWMRRFRPKSGNR
ncbi:MAG: hypothetical protein WC683_12005 [bacterium]